MGTLGWIFLLLSDSLANFWAHLMLRDTSKLPKEERAEAQAEAVAARVLVVGVVLAVLLVYAYVSLT